MIVTFATLQKVVNTFRQADVVAIDVETTGLRPYHGDRIFSFALVADVLGKREKAYFNFKPYDNLPSRFVLSKAEVMPYLQEWLFAEAGVLWVAHNAKFELHMLGRESCELKGPVHCTQVQGRVEYNAFQEYDLGTSLERIGLAKDDAVMAYIVEHGLKEKFVVPGRKHPGERMFFDRVPFSIMMPYCLMDTEGALELYYSQVRSVEEQDSATPDGVPRLMDVVLNERKLTKTLFKVERNGCRIDREYCRRAIVYTAKVRDEARSAMETAVGREHKDSSKFYADLFRDHDDEFSHTEKGGLSFDKSALKKITSPHVASLLRYRMATNRLGFYNGFLYHADEAGFVHPSFNADVVKHGRLSCSNPNFQNLKADDIEDFSEAELETEFFVRRAVIPRDGNYLLMPDYKNAEYKMYLEYICILNKGLVPLAERVNDGMNFHDAMLAEAQARGFNITKKQIKIVNFLTIYEGGPGAVAANIGCTMSQAKEFQRMIHLICPQGRQAREEMMKTARSRGWIYNWLGRRCHFPVSRFAYRAANYAISGGCAEVMKIAMNDTQDYIEARHLESRLISTIHDELVLDCPPHEAQEMSSTMVKFMEEAYPAKYVPQTVDFEWSNKSMFDKIKGVPS